MTKADRYLENAQRCMMLVDRYADSATAVTFEGAARSWMLLHDLELKARHNGLCDMEFRHDFAGEFAPPGPGRALGQGTRALMQNPLTMRLEQFAHFTDVEKRRLDELISHGSRTYAPREPILKEGQKVDEIHLVLTGLAARSKDLPDGDRQIMAFLIPGDLCDVEVFVLEAMDHDILAVTETTCALIPAKKVEELLSEFSKLTKALWWSTMTDSAVLRERIIDHGRRDARERIAHLFYEMLVRYRVIGTKDNEFPFPVTQEELADATGLTPVHVNRTLKLMREERLVEYRDKVLKVPNPDRLKRAARFEPNYLHLHRTENGDHEVATRAGDLI